MYVCISINLSISVPTTAVAVFRNPNTIPFCLTTDLLLDVLFPLYVSIECMYLFSHIYFLKIVPLIMVYE
jgi:hypothetical protein